MVLLLITTMVSFVVEQLRRSRDVSNDYHTRVKIMQYFCWICTETAVIKIYTGYESQRRAVKRPSSAMTAQAQPQVRFDGRQDSNRLVDVIRGLRRSVRFCSGKFVVVDHGIVVR